MKIILKTLSVCNLSCEVFFRLVCSEERLELESLLNYLVTAKFTSVFHKLLLRVDERSEDSYIGIIDVVFVFRKKS